MAEIVVEAKCRRAFLDPGGPTLFFPFPFSAGLACAKLEQFALAKFLDVQGPGSYCTAKGIADSFSGLKAKRSHRSD